MSASVSPFLMTPDAWMQQWSAAFQKVAALPKVAEVAKRTRVGTTPAQSVYREDKLNLLRYDSDVEKRYKTPLLFVFALVNRPYILDLKPGKSVVAHFLNRGFDTYNIDWGVPTYADRNLGLEDYVLRYMDHCVNQIRERTGSDKVNILGYCMGGSMSAMYTALRPKKVKNFIALAAPFDWSARDSLLEIWTDEKYFDIDQVLEVHGNAPADWLQSSFLLLKPVQNLMEKYIGFFENMEDEKYLEDFFAMETWLNDNIPVAGQVFRQFVKLCFQRNLPIQGKLEIRGERVDFKNIECPFLNLVAQNDHLVTPSQSLPLNNAVGSKDRKAITLPAGHIGLAVGSRAHRELWPKACDWLQERSKALRS